MVSRRAPGVLESEVLALLWQSAAPLAPDQIRRRVGGDLAYTTVTTILSRLHDKGAVCRHPNGRGYLYSPVLDQAGLAANRMRALLDDQTDRVGVLSRFVAGLDLTARTALRSALDPPPEP